MPKPDRPQGRPPRAWRLPSRLRAVSGSGGYRLVCTWCPWRSAEMDPVADWAEWRRTAERHVCLTPRDS